MMALQFVVGAVALLWLLHRATRLLKIPAPVLIHILGIDIPEAPKVSIDSISDNSVSMHWNPPEKAATVVKYILEIDGKKAGETDRSDSHVTIRDLVPDRQYSLTILAVNVNNYRSHSQPILLRTKKRANETLPDGVQLGIRDDNPKTLRHRASSKALAGAGASKGRKRAGTGGMLANGHSKDKNVYSVEQLTTEVENTQLEINELVLQAFQSEKEFQVQESVLIEQLEHLRERKKVDDAQRSLIRQEAKSLEDSKRSLETQRLKFDKRLKILLEEKHKKENAEERWTKEIEQAESQISGFEKAYQDLEAESEEKLESIEAQIRECQQSISQAEDEVKKLASNNRKNESKKSSTLGALEETRKLSSETNGVIPDDVLTNILESGEVDDEFKDAMKQEADTETHLEEEWKQAQKELEMRYLDVKMRYEEALTAHREAATQLDRARNRSSNVVLDSLNAAMQAIPGRRKSRRGKGASKLPISAPIPQVSTLNTQSPPHIQVPQLNSHSSQASLQQPLLSQASTSSFGYGADRSSNTALPNGQLTAQTSQPYFNTSQPSFAHPHMHQPPSISSRRVSVDTSYQPDVDESEMLASPSLQMLLPSYLLGADDLTESFASLLRESQEAETRSRPSAGILGQALHSKSSRSFDRNVSPKPSILSIASEGSGISGAVPASPQSSYTNFGPGFSRASVFSNGIAPMTSNPMETVQEINAVPASRKFANMFSFGRQNRRAGSGSGIGASSSQLEPPLFDNISVHSNEITSGRPRAESYSSVHSRPSNIYSPWRSDIPPTTDTSNFLLPAVSNNGSTLSFESPFGIIGSGSASASRTDLTSSQLWNNNPRNSSHLSQPPQLIVTDKADDFAIIGSGQSVDSRSSAGGSGSKFSKSFAGLFSSSPSDKDPKEKMEKDKSIASLFGKSEDEMEPKENVFQKSMRAFTPRKSSSSGSATSGGGKFKVRSLSFFGGKKGDTSKDEDSTAIEEEEEDDDYEHSGGTPSTTHTPDLSNPSDARSDDVDYREFLARAH